ncbi:MAG TPA: carbohydrate kinase family protein [Candidatus Paceibacterota bacterium]
MSKVITSGSVAYDRIMDYGGLFADSFVPDKIHNINLSFKVDKLSVEFGGTAGNVAYSLALLGEQAEIIATVGADFGSYRAHMLLSGVDPTTIHEVEGELTASAVLFTDRADNQIAAYHPGAGGHAYDTPVNTDGRALAIVSPGCEADMMSLPPYYRRRGLRYLYDPGQQITALTPEALKDAITGAHVLFASDYELGLIAQKTGWAEGSLLQNVPTVVVTYGVEGSRVVTREGDWRVASTPAKTVIDPTGAGDAYRAGFIKGIFLGLPLQSCGRLGSTVAAYAVETYGTQTHKFTLQELADRYQKTHGEKLPV